MTRKTTASAAAADPRFENGPLAVIDCEDGQVSAYCVGGLVLDVPAKSIPALVDWTLTEARLGQARLHRHGRDADPILVLTASALERYGLPAALSDEERRAGRLAAGHKVVKQIERAGLQLTQRGFGPWARVYRDPEGSRRRCVRLCILPWNALDAREWDKKDDPQLPTMHPAGLARYLGLYAARVMTPRGSTATTGLELMTALRPPTRAQKDEATGEFKPAFNDDAITAKYDVVPCEVPDEHPILKDAGFARHHIRTPAEMLMEEPYDWCRPLTDEECANPCLVVVDINMSFAAAANGLTVGLNGPTHLTASPKFDPALPGSWLVDLSHVDLSRVQINGRTVDGSRLPSPFTPKGDHPTGPAWYATPTLAYAQELGFDVAPIEAYVRTRTGRYLDPCTSGCATPMWPRWRTWASPPTSRDRSSSRRWRGASRSTPRWRCWRPRSRRPRRAPSANCASAAGARCRTTSPTRRWSGGRGAPTSGPPCSRPSASACTAS